MEGISNVSLHMSVKQDDLSTLKNKTGVINYSKPINKTAKNTLPKSKPNRRGCQIKSNWLGEK